MIKINKLSRKERKKLTDLKRQKWEDKIMDYWKLIGKDKSLTLKEVLKIIDQRFGSIIEQQPHEAHLIRSACRNIGKIVSLIITKEDSK